MFRFHINLFFLTKLHSFRKKFSCKNFHRHMLGHFNWPSYPRTCKFYDIFRQTTSWCGQSTHRCCSTPHFVFHSKPARFLLHALGIPEMEDRNQMEMEFDIIRDRFWHVCCCRSCQRCHIFQWPSGHQRLRLHQWVLDRHPCILEYHICDTHIVNIFTCIGMEIDEFVPFFEYSSATSVSDPVISQWSSALGPSIFDIYLYIMLSINLLGLIGCIGVQVHSAASSFGCVSAAAHLSEYIILVPLIAFCSYWHFHRSPELQVVPEDEINFLSGNESDRY